MSVIENNTVQELIDKCWIDATGLQIEPTKLADLANPEDLFIASVIFSGDNQGSLTVAMGEVLAKQLAGNMFDSSIESVSLDDIRDSIGELANVLAGNIKTDFFGNCSMAKPVVMRGSDAMISVFQIDAIFQRIFVSAKDEQILIQVCQTA